MMLELMRNCSKKHSAMTASAAQGQGWDRHLFALRVLAESEGTATPGLFADPAYVAINKIILSTSTLSSNNFAAGAFMPVQPDGFGLPYQACRIIFI
jgi:carnitine O-palmitoyltransferase 2